MRVCLESIAPAANQAPSRRRAAQRLAQWALHLPSAQRQLVHAVYLQGLSATAYARQASLAPRTCQKQLRRLVLRLRHPLFDFLVNHHDLLTPAVARTARLVVFQGLPLRQAALRQALPLHHVRRHMLILRTLARID